MRGYNQSEALAHGLAARLRLPVRPGWLRRVRATPIQPTQTLAGRRENVRGAFAAPKRLVVGKTLLLVDDVMTTGATVSEAARALPHGRGRARRGGCAQPRSWGVIRHRNTRNAPADGTGRPTEKS